MRREWICALVLLCGCRPEYYLGEIRCSNNQRIEVRLSGDAQTIEALSGVQIQTPYAGDASARLRCSVALIAHHDSGGDP